MSINLLQRLLRDLMQLEERITTLVDELEDALDDVTDVLGDE